MMNIYAFMKFFYYLVKLWTLFYGPKAPWSNSQKAKLIGFSKVSSETPLIVPFIWHTSYPSINSWGPNRGPFLNNMTKVGIT